MKRLWAILRLIFTGREPKLQEVRVEYRRF
jgi:hypothetical protein